MATSSERSSGKKAAKKTAKKTAKKGAGKKSAKKTAKKGAGKKTAKKTAKKGAGKKTAKKATKSSGAQRPTMKGAAAKAKSAAEDVSVIVQSRVKELVREHDLRVDGELVAAVNRRVKEMLQAAAGRAKGNNRKTVRPHDL